MTLTIPSLPGGRTEEVFVETPHSPFGAVDGNLAAWLPGAYGETSETSCDSFILSEHKNNQELIELLGGEDAVRELHLFTPQQIRYLAENTNTADILLKDGFSNLFFVCSPDEKELYIVGVVWDKEVEKFVPYIYRIRNLYRSWSKGNRVFVRSS